MYVGKLIDVVDYLSKWTNAIVTHLNKDKQLIKVVVDGDLEMEFTWGDINSEIIAPFQSKTDPWSPDKIQKLKENLNSSSKEDKSDNIITKKANKGKRHQANPNTSISEEPDIKPEVRNYNNISIEANNGFGRNNYEAKPNNYA